METRPMYMLPVRELTSDLKTQTESQGIDTDIPCKWESKDSVGGYTYSRQNRC